MYKNRKAICTASAKVTCSMLIAAFCKLDAELILGLDLRKRPLSFAFSSLKSGEAKGV